MKNWKSVPTDEIISRTKKRNYYKNTDTKTNTRFPSMTERNDISLKSL